MKLALPDIKYKESYLGALKEAKKIGFEKVLLTCNDDNTGSWKIIEANGGILEGTVEPEKDGEKKKRRYWITIKK